jgi:hypothetical protein
LGDKNYFKIENKWQKLGGKKKTATRTNILRRIEEERGGGGLEG